MSAKSIESENAPRRYIRIEQIHERSNTRQFYDQAKLAELAESIRLHGVETDVVLRPARVPGGGVIPNEFEIITGHRRCRAAKLAGLTEVPARVEDLSDQEVLEKQLVENGQREDISELEEGTAFRRLKEEYGLTDAQIASRVCRKESTVRERRRLAGIGPEGRKALEQGKISPQVGLELARIPNAKVQAEATRAVIAGKQRYDWEEGRNVAEPFTVREARDLIVSEYFLDLAKAAFDPSDVTLSPERGACASCPHRSKAQPDMFEDPKGPDLCLDSPCFKAKTEAHWDRLKERAKEEGREVLPEKKTKEVFEHGQLKHGAPYVELDDPCHQDPKGRPYKKLLPKDAPIVLARDDRGDVHQLVKRDQIEELLELAGHEFDDRPTIAGGTLSPAEKKERERQRKQSRLVAAALPRIVKQAEIHLPNEGFWNALFGIYWHLTETIRPVAKRRGYEGPASDAKKWLMKQAATMQPHQLRGLVLELALTPATEFSNGKLSDRFTAAAAAYGIDLKKLGAELEAEKSAPKKPAEDSVLKWSDLGTGSKGKGANGRVYEIEREPIGTWAGKQGFSGKWRWSWELNKVSLGVLGQGPFPTLEAAKSACEEAERERLKQSDRDARRKEKSAGKAKPNQGALELEQSPNYCKGYDDRDDSDGPCMGDPSPKTGRCPSCTTRQAYIEKRKREGDGRSKAKKGRAA